MKKSFTLITVFLLLITSLTSVCYAVGPTITEPLGGITSEGLEWRYNDASRSEIWIIGGDPDKMPENLIIPSEITRWSIILQKDVTAPVTRILVNAFDYNQKLKHVTIPDNVTSIDYSAFSECYNLESVVLPNTLTSLGFNNSRIAYLDDVPFYPQGAVFANCHKLTSIKLPDSLKTTCKDMFHSCKNLENVEFPEGLEEIGEWTFGHCPKLKNVILPSSLKTIKLSAFSDCEELTEIVIPPNVTTLESLAFQRCTGLAHIVVPESVKTFGETTKGNIDTSVFPYSNNITIYGVPGSAVEEYIKYYKNFTFKPISEYPYSLPDYYTNKESVTDDAVSVTVNNKTIEFDQPPIIENGRTLVPVRAIFEAMGAEVNWDDATQTVSATNGVIEISLQINSTNMYVKNHENGLEDKETITLDVPAKLINGRTLIPVRAVSEAFGCKVDWIEDTKTVVITQ